MGVPTTRRSTPMGTRQWPRPIAGAVIRRLWLSATAEEPADGFPYPVGRVTRRFNALAFQAAQPLDHPLDAYSQLLRSGDRHARREGLIQREVGVVEVSFKDEVDFDLVALVLQ